MKRQRRQHLQIWLASFLALTIQAVWREVASVMAIYQHDPDCELQALQGKQLE